MKQKNFHNQSINDSLYQNDNSNSIKKSLYFARLSIPYQGKIQPIRNERPSQEIIIASNIESNIEN
jgi:hypothetical protein